MKTAKKNSKPQDGNIADSMEKDIAIIGMSCRFPGAVDYLQYWDNLLAGVNSVTVVPSDRWDWREVYGDPKKDETKTNSKWGGFIEDVDKFDPLFFNISPKEANFIDPQHRLFLQTVWHTIEDAGYSPAQLAGKKVGVYAGVSKNDYAEMLGEHIAAFVSTGTVHSILVNRVSYLMDFRGPSVAFDTACSSALVALHNAVRDIKSGDCEVALVGGVNVLLSPRMYISHGQSGMLSPDGQCHTFDESANGYVRGEGVGVVMIKPLVKAIADDDNIVAVVKATAINHGGRANFLTAPNVQAQSEVVLSALETADISPLQIGYIEAHGTGTPLGDPIEINGLKKAYREYFAAKDITPEHNYCALGSAKSNVGHLESAAGMAGLIKLVMCLRFGKLPKLANFNKINPYIELDESPFFIADNVIDWPQDKRHAGLSSFGMGGVNAHVIVGQAPKRAEREVLTGQVYPILLSAKKGRLKAVAEQLLVFIMEFGQDLECCDIAFTLMTGRQPLEERMVLMVQDNDQLVKQLKTYLGDEPVNLLALPEEISRWLDAKDTKQLIPNFDGRRVALPGYPFATRLCWFKEKSAEIHINTTDVVTAESIVLTQDDTFVADHLVQQVPTLPGMAYLILVRQELHKQNKKQVHFKDVFWLRPMRFNSHSTHLSLALESHRQITEFTVSTADDQHCKGFVDEFEWAQQNFELPDMTGARHISKVDLYTAFQQHGLNYGPSMQLLEQVQILGEHATAVLRQGFGHHIAILDAALQTAVALTVYQDNHPTEQFLPYFAESVELSDHLSDIRQVYVKQLKRQKKLLVFDIYCLGEQGEILAKFSSFKKRILKVPTMTMHYYASKWLRHENQSQEKPQGVLVINGQAALIDSLQAGADVTLAQLNGKVDDHKAAFDTLKQGDDISHIVVQSQNPGAEELTTLLNIVQGVILSRWRSVKQISYVGVDFNQEQACYFYAAGGLARTLKYENPNLQLCVIGLQQTPLTLTLLNQAPTPMQEIRYVKGEREARLMLPVIDSEISKDKIVFKPDGVYIIAGGAGGLGKIFSLEIAKQKVHLVLLGRRQADDAIKAHLGEIEALGAKATYIGVDTTDLAALRQALKPFKKIHGVIQSAGLIEDKYILQKSASSFNRVLSPKIEATVNLDTVTQRHGLDFFVLFSSVASIIPNQGQCDYASGNSFLDYFAVYRNRLCKDGKRSGHTVAINWPLWAQGGMQVTVEEKQHLWSVFGMEPLPTQKGIDFLHAAVNTGIAQLLGISGDGEKIRRHFNSTVTPVKSKEQLLKENLILIMALALKIDPEKLSDDVEFSDLGLGSLGLLTLTSMINQTFGLDIKPTIFFEYNSLMGLKRYLIDRFKTQIRGRFAELGHLLQTYTCHSLIDIAKTDLSQKRFQRTFTNKEFYQIDHVVAGQYNLPGACYVEMARQAAVFARPGHKVTALANNFWAKQLSSPGPAFTAYIQVKDVDEGLAYEIYSLDDNDEKVVNASGLALYDLAGPQMPRLDLAAIRQRCKHSRSRDQVYEQIHAEDLIVGPSFMPIQSIVLNENEALAQLSLPSMVMDTWEEYLLHPTMLTGVFQTALINNRIDGDDDRQFIPVGIDKLYFYTTIAPICYVYSKLREQSRGHAGLKKFDVSVCDENGNILLYLESFAIKVRPGTGSVATVSATKIVPVATAKVVTVAAGQVEDYLKALLAPSIGMDKAEIDANEAFESYGINSVMVLELNKLMEQAFGNALSKTLFFEYQSIAELAAYLLEDHKAQLQDKLTLSAEVEQPAAGSAPGISTTRLSALEASAVVDDTVLQQATELRLKELLAPSIGLIADEIHADDAFETYGINSVMVLELNKLMEQHFGNGLSKTLFFEYQTLAELAQYLIEEHLEQLRSMLPLLSSITPATNELPMVSVTVASAGPEAMVPVANLDIAVIGIAGRYPKANDLQGLWHNLTQGKDCIEKVPFNRFDTSQYSDTLTSTWGSFIDDVDMFDPLFFNISPREAELIDPQERLFLQVAWQCIEDAGYRREQLSGQPIGVYAGVLWQPYLEQAVLAHNQGQITGPSTLLYSVANRVSYTFNFTGPSLAIDTACSASLTALHLACQSIIKQESNLALAGGVNLSIGASKYLFLNQYNFLSSDGRCRSFGERGDGYVPGEGVGCVLLKPLTHAELDGDHIYGVIKGTGINHGGKTNGYTVPNPKAQAALIRQTLATAGVNAKDISYVEAHGTGTPLGDPIEFNSLTKVFREYCDDKQFCAIGSIKSNIGHLEASAGIAGLTKILLQMKHKQLVPSLHAKQLNPLINFVDSPFVVNQQLKDWTVSGSRIAALSSFGAGGANAHAIIAEYQRPNQSQSSGDVVVQVIIPLSAKTPAVLEQKAQQLLQFVRGAIAGEHSLDLLDMAYTLQMGREEMEQRLGLVVDSIADFADKLDGYLTGTSPSAVFSGRLGDSDDVVKLSQDEDMVEAINKWIDRKKLAKLVSLWVKGMAIDWSRLYGQYRPKRVSLPVYPFAKERYWLAISSANNQGRLHPLLHKNTSSLAQQSYRSTFGGDEFFLSDHRISTPGNDARSVLPAVTYLEMARAAVVSACPDIAGDEAIELNNVVWVKPVLVDSAQAVEIVLFEDDDGTIEYEITTHSTNTEQDQVHGQGQAYFIERPESLTLDIPQLKAQLGPVKFDREGVYRGFKRMGLEYGPAHQGITAIYQDTSQLLAQIELPAPISSSVNDYVLHPSVMDSALQASLGLVFDFNRVPDKPTLPFALETLRVLAPCTEQMYAYACFAQGSSANDSVVRVDIELCDSTGLVCVQMHGFNVRTIEGNLFGETQIGIDNFEHIKPGLLTMVPTWQALVTDIDPRVLATDQPVLLLGNDEKQLSWAQQSCAVSSLELTPDAEVEEIEAQLAAAQFDHLLWMAPEPSDDLIAAQNHGVIAVYRIAKALLKLGYGERELAWTVITYNSQKVTDNDQVQPTHGSISGLMGAMSKEFPQWQLRTLDVDNLDSVCAAQALGSEIDAGGNPRAYRHGEWFRQGLSNLGKIEPQLSLYKHGGVYVIIGGAGGLGEVFSEVLVEQYQATVVWLGRRALDNALQSKLDRLATKGPAPLYLQTDATSLSQLIEAKQNIMQRYGRINGVVHSAIILKDQSLAQMSEQRFKSALTAKVDISVNMDQVFGAMDLDFMLFFSSLMSFIKTQGQSNYAAGCTFKDSFAQSVQSQRRYPVKTINWGFWGTVGVVTDAFYNQRMARMGIGSIEAKEGMAVLEQFINSDHEQMLVMKTLSNQGLAEVDLLSSQIRYPQANVAVLKQVQQSLPQQASAATVAQLQDKLVPESMSQLVGRILAASLASIGLFCHGKQTLRDLPSSVPAFYERWLLGSIEYLKQQQLLSVELTLEPSLPSLESLWAEFDAQKPAWLASQHLKAQVKLLDACLRALPDILLGKQLSTDVIFPDSSVELVAGIYRDNAIADYYNEVLGNTLCACIEQQLQTDPNCRIRILEVGAGTGGTTSRLIPKLQAYGDNLAEYCYTDLSKAFLMYAEQHYQPSLPAITTAIFDISKPLAGQPVSKGQYDYVIGTNVLHATPNIRETMRNAKALLKDQGVVLVNEISDWSLVYHLSFGLLDGWWLYQDKALRLPATPALAPDTWRKVLHELGYDPVFFPAQNAHPIGQQIVAAASDGVAVQTLDKAAIMAQSESSVEKHGEPVAVKAAAKPTNATSAVASTVPVKAPVAKATLTEGASLHQLCIGYFKQLVASAFKMQAQQVDAKQSLDDYGLDSILVVQLTNQLRKDFPDVKSTLFFEVQTVEALADYFIANRHDEISAIVAGADVVATSAPIVSAPVAEKVASELLVRSRTHNRRRGRTASDTSAQVTSSTTSSTTFSIVDVAVIGLAGRYPKADDIDTFWYNLTQGFNGISEIPAERWQWQDHFDEQKGLAGKMYSRWGGFLNDIDTFDPLFFKLSPKEAKRMDPQERQFLQTCYHAIEDAGYTPDSLDRANRVGVFAGVMNSRYTPQPLYHSISNRVSYLCNFQGPSITIDTACSASLTAVHLALESLYSGLSHVALAGGVNLVIDAVHYLELSAMTMLSQGDKCKSFGDNADGFVDAEGVGAVLLKPLSQAQNDGDHIYAVVKGSSVNAGGKTNGYTVPNPIAQADVVLSALQRSKVSAEQLGYIEAHGTGTALGDPIEIAGLTRAFKQSTDKTGFCAIGSLKSNMGHAESAAGIAGLTKLLLQLKYQQLVPSLHSEVTNSEIDFDRTPFKVQHRLSPWPSPTVMVDGVEQQRPRTGGISSFGAGGANAHVIVQQYLAPSDNVDIQAQISKQLLSITQGQVLVVLSARTAEQLRQKAVDLLAWLNQSEPLDSAALVSLAYTLQVGRVAMEERLALLVGDVPQLSQQLQDFIAGKAPKYRDGVKRNKQTAALYRNDEQHQSLLAGYVEGAKLKQLAPLWVNGVEVDWRELYADNKPQRSRLPLYPFAKDRYWIEPSRGVSASGVTTGAAGVLHPMLHQNVSNLAQQGFATTFSGNEFFLTDHLPQLAGSGKCKVLPAVVYLEMVRAAVNEALPGRLDKQILELQSTQWGDTFIAQGQKINLVLIPNGADRVDYECYSQGESQELIHCQGHGVLANKPPQVVIDLNQLRTAMTGGKLGTGTVRQTLLNHGIEQGPAVSAIVDIELGDNQALVQLRLPESLKATSDSLLLHPSLLDAALSGAVALFYPLEQLPQQPSLPVSIGLLRQFMPCSVDMYAWVRIAGDTQMSIDIDWYDSRGVLCLQMLSVRYHSAELAPQQAPLQQSLAPVSAELPPVRTPAPLSAPQSAAVAAANLKATAEPRQLIITSEPSVVSGATLASDFVDLARIKPAAVGLPSLEPLVTAFVVPLTKPDSIVLPALSHRLSGVTLNKPNTVALATVMPVAAQYSAPSEKPNITLDPPSLQANTVETVRLLTLQDCADGLYILEVPDPVLDLELSRLMVKALNRAALQDNIKTLMIKMGLSGDRTSCNGAIDSGLYQGIIDFPYPLIASLAGDTTGAGFMLAALCDFMVCSQQSHYGFNNIQQGLLATSAEDALFSTRFGDDLAARLLDPSVLHTGAALQQAGFTFTVVSRSQVASQSQQLAEQLIDKPPVALKLLKQHLSTALSDKVQQFKLSEGFAPQPSNKLTPVKTASRGLKLSVDSAAETTLTVRLAKASKVSTVINALENVFAQLSQSGHKAVVLGSDCPTFINVASAKESSDDIRRLQNLLLNAPVPVIVAFEHDASDGALIAGLFADSCIYASKGQYQLTGDWLEAEQIQTKVAIAAIAKRRLGEQGARQLLLGAEFKWPRVDDVMAKAQHLASAWADAPIEVLNGYKRQQAQRLAALLADLPQWPDSFKTAEFSAAVKEVTEVNLGSKVVKFSAYPDGVALIQMQDRQARNMFSDAFVEGINAAFDHIAQHPAQYKVVVLSGYDNYFASGGTKASLQAIQQGKLKFTDLQIYHLALACPLPVISAMQGHGLGGGWSLGMFADFMVFSEQSTYISPYMNYGFTPGAGATLIYPDRLGWDLARDSLFTGVEYTGKLLRDKGMRLPVMAKGDVIDAAMSQAHNIAQQPKTLLLGYKALLSDKLRTALQDNYDKELAMHQLSFVGQDTAAENIDSLFIDTADSITSESPSEPMASAAQSVSLDLVNSPASSPVQSLAQTVAQLRGLLAEELHMAPQDVDEQTEFVDLGLDSINSVTFVRKVNDIYRINMAATKVYAYPTLETLAAYVNALSQNQNECQNPAPVIKQVSSVSAVKSMASVSMVASNLPAPAPAQAELQPPVANKILDPQQLKVNLKLLLAEELHMQVSDVDEDSEFVDLGLDSINSVTFVRKVNETYHTNMEATKVYAYPTLNQLCDYVQQLVQAQASAQASNQASNQASQQTVANSQGPQTGAVQSMAATPAPAQAASQPQMVTTTLDPQQLKAELKRLLADELHMQVADVAEDSEFVDLGLDSINSVTFVRKVNDAYHINMEATKVYAYPTLNQLCGYVQQQTQTQADSRAISTAVPTTAITSSMAKPMSATVSMVATPAKATPAPISEGVTDRLKVIAKPAVALPHKLSSWRTKRSVGGVNTASNAPIAVIGMAGQFPMSNDLDSYWDNIASGKNCIAPIPAERWDSQRYYQAGNITAGKTNCNWMGAMEHYDKFDPLFFNISPLEAERIDPQQRLFMQACWHGIEHAGYDAKALSGSRTAVYVGCTHGDYHHLYNEHQLSAQDFTGAAMAILSARISYYLNLHGPSLAIDTACSSSLVAISSACDALCNGGADMALAGGVSLMAGPAMHIKCSQSGMLSVDGQCFAFDQRANGFVPSEGVGVVVLKRLSDAEKDRDTVLGVIRGWGLNQDGKTNGITAPNPTAQTRLEKEVYDRFAIDPSDIQLIETHGTGTKLGDPIEVEGLKNAFAGYTKDIGFCALGSVKSNVGHCLTAAGISGFIKLLLALKHKQLPPSGNFQQLNEHICLDNSPFYVNERLRDWSVGPDKTRHAAISAFGFSGTNAHLVLAEYVPRHIAYPAAKVVSENGKQMAVLSAKSEPQLKQKAQDLLLMVNDNKPDLTALCYSLQVSRQGMEYRLGFMVDSNAALSELLQAFVDGQSYIADSYQGNVNRDKESIRVINADALMKQTVVAKFIDDGKLGKLLDLWVKGLDFDWHLLYGEFKPQRIALPLYPFAKQRYWIKEGEGVRYGSALAATHGYLHPLLHRNISDLSQQAYASEFNGDEFFLTDHKVQTTANSAQSVLPGVAHLEMVRCAVALAVSNAPPTIVLRNVIWAQPVVVTEPKTVNIALFSGAEPDDPAMNIDFQIYSRENDEEIVHSQGVAMFSDEPPPRPHDVAALRAQMNGGSVVGDKIYQGFKHMGLQYGPGHQGIEQVWLGDGAILAELKLPAAANEQGSRYQLNPGLVDSALQSAITLIADIDNLPDLPVLPFALDTLKIYQACSDELLVWARLGPGTVAGDKVIKLDFDLCDTQGRVCVQLLGLSMRFLSAELNHKDSVPRHERQKPINGNGQGSKDFDESYYQKVLEQVMNHEISIDDAAKLG